MKKFLFLSVLACSAVYASPPPGTYELYNGDGIKTGDITSTFDGTHLTTVTKIEYPATSGDYRYTETDNAEILNGKLVSFRRESDDNGKKYLYIGELRGGQLVINYQIDDQKFSTGIATATYDLTDFEMDLTGSKFRALKPGENKTLKVFFLDRMDVVPVSRNVSTRQKFSYENSTVSVLIANTLVKGKVTTSYFNAENGQLLQEEGEGYLMSRVEK